MKSRLLWQTIVFLLFTFSLKAQKKADSTQPAYWLELIGNKLVRETPFRYAARLSYPNKTFNWVQFVDFKRALGKESGIAYAYTELIAEQDRKFHIDISHSGKCSVWVNDELVYAHTSEKGLMLKFEERSIELENSFDVELKKGRNKVIIKSQADEKDWVVYISPPSTKGAVLQQQLKYPKIGLEEVPYVQKGIADVANWLIIGPFDSADTNDEVLVKEWTREIVFGKMYPAQGSTTTWTIPKLEIAGTSINPTPWGTNYDWNYHNGGVAWAMQELFHLSRTSRNQKSKFCNFTLLWNCSHRDIARKSAV